VVEKAETALETQADGVVVRANIETSGTPEVGPDSSFINANAARHNCHKAVILSGAHHTLPDGLALGGAESKDPGVAHLTAAVPSF
jgi:hypothetical protein